MLERWLLADLVRVLLGHAADISGRIGAQATLESFADVLGVGRIASGLLLTSGQNQQKRNDRDSSPTHGDASITLGDGVVLVRRQQHVLREIDLDAMALKDCDRGRNLHEAIKSGGCRLRDTCSGASGESL